MAKDGVLDGVIVRLDAASALAEGRPVPLIPAISARPSQTIRECQSLLIESPCGMIIITDQARGTPLAVVTLHDLLRAQASISEREG